MSRSTLSYLTENIRDVKIYLKLSKEYIAKERQMLGVLSKEMIEMFVGKNIRTSQFFFALRRIRYWYRVFP